MDGLMLFTIGYLITTAYGQFAVFSNPGTVMRMIVDKSEDPPVRVVLALLVSTWIAGYAVLIHWTIGALR